VTPDTTLDPSVPQPIQPPSTAGMTTKVVKGSLWTLAGSVVPLAVAFVTTPFTIRLLGPEGYGVLLLVGLIPTYLLFADFGMGIASTRFASEAFGEGDYAKERDVVWTATSIACVAASVVALPIFIFSTTIASVFNVPEHFLTQASIALKITSVAFVLGIAASVLNSPMLARLRMDLNTVTQAVPKMLLSGLTPLIIYYGGGIVGAVSWAFIVSCATLATVFYFSGRLLPSLFQPVIVRKHIVPLLKFGGAWVIGSVAAILLVNFEKLALSRMVSVKALAYYSVAFTFASMATIFAQAMIQSLVPAFSQLLPPEKKKEFNTLFQRGMRLNLILLVPGLTALLVVAKPFFTLWAGEDFGRESTTPFYILAFGLFFNILAYIPYTSILAHARTDIFAKLYWIELALYLVMVLALVSYFGIIGAAIAWSVRVALDTLAIVYFSNRVARTEFRYLYYVGRCLLGGIVLVPALVLAALDNYSLWLFLTLPVCLLVYGALIWLRFLDQDERNWLKQKVRILNA
jgi:O-antigen/teichoic acid export membrane protein